ncbi:MAG: hydantoinase B/oxoprolinase family protein [Caldilineaceae bacterium]
MLAHATTRSTPSYAPTCADPEEVIGDLDALVAANAVGARRMLHLMHEYGLSDLRDLSAAIQERTETAVSRNRRHPRRRLQRANQFDALHTPLTIAVSIRVAGSDLHVDYTGSAHEVSPGGINATLSYTSAQTFYTLMCVLAPHLPHNEGSLRPFEISAPLGSILNCRFRAGEPAPAQRLAPEHGDLRRPGRRAAGSGDGRSGFLAAFQARGRRPDGSNFNVPFFAGGGQGAGYGRPGRAGYIYPSTAAGMSVEVFEGRTPLLIRSKAILPESGGLGRWRGGPGQRAGRYATGLAEPVEFLITQDRMTCPAPGLNGGGDDAFRASAGQRRSARPIPPSTPRLPHALFGSRRAAVGLHVAAVVGRRDADW